MSAEPAAASPPRSPIRKVVFASLVGTARETRGSTLHHDRVIEEVARR